jgi:hypothetical protein
VNRVAFPAPLLRVRRLAPPTLERLPRCRPQIRWPKRRPHRHRQRQHLPPPLFRLMSERGRPALRRSAQSRRLPGKQIAPPQAISEEAVLRMQNNPWPNSPGRKGRGSSVNYTIDHDHHELAWRRLGGHNDAPPAFVYDDQVYLDPSRWPPKR